MKATIALAGNPNSGKTTLFNNLTGATAYVGNWPGVTVEKKEGTLRENAQVTVVDLPGIYSLSPYTPEEVVSRDFLMHGGPGAILNLVDSTNIERNLYLTSQILETGLPLVIALNMTDLILKNGDVIDIDRLSKELGAPIVEISALKGTGTLKAATLAATLAGSGAPPPKPMVFTSAVEMVLGGIADRIKDIVAPERLRWYTIKLFERDAQVAEELTLDAATLKAIDKAVARLETQLDDDAESIITSERYERVTDIVRDCVRKKHRTETTSDKIDRIVTNRFLALPLFAAIMMLVYYISIMSVGSFVTDWANDVLFGEIIGGTVGGWLTAAGAAVWLNSLIVDGVIAGVGAVLGFVPQMVVLFLLLGFLEDCGYMARVAFIMDRIFRKFGLSGKSFIPMLISSGCGVPGIMASKTIENEKDRRMTIITTTFIPCGAKLPIIALIGGAVLGNRWWVSPLIYFVGVASVIVSGIILKKTKLFAGEVAPFVMELPQYHLPSPKNLLLHMWERVRSFIAKAGTVIFVSSILIWFLLAMGVENGSFTFVTDVQNSLMAFLGGLVAPLLIPLGFGNWQSAVGIVAGLVAKENLVTTMAIIQGLSDTAVSEILDETQPMWAYMSTILPTVAAGLSFLIFNMLCAPCFAAIGAIRRQMMNWKWTVFAICYQTLFAYAIALMTYQFITFLSGGPFTAGTAAALVVLAFFLYMLFRPSPQKRGRLNRASASN